MSPLAQVAALLALRWSTVRGARARTAVPLAVLVALGVVALALVSAGRLSGPALETAVELAPQAFLGFGVLALVAPLAAGGGGELVPPDQLVAYPVQPATQLAGGLLLAPLNLVWVLQLTVLAAETGFLARGGALAPALAVTGAYVVAMTVVGQALAWTVVGARQTRTGRRAVAAGAAALTVVALLLLREGPEGLPQAPGRLVADGVVAGAQADAGRWVGTLAVLLALTAAALLLGTRSCAWALRRPSDAAVRSSRSLPRSPLRRTPLGQLVALDRGSAWRAPALRRGALVLALLPGALAAGAEVPWSSLVVLPGLVGAGAGLLFGVNLFSLDGPGALWVASLPVDPRLLARSKLLVLTETVLGAAVVAAACGAVRSPGAPTAAELVAILVSLGCCTAVVVAGCLSCSVRRPHRAELRGPRDAVAPPGALALASLRLALPTAVVGIVLEAASATGEVLLAPLLAVPVLLLCALSLRRSLARWADPVRRAHVVQVVSAG